LPCAEILIVGKAIKLQNLTLEGKEQESYFVSSSVVNYAQREQLNAIIKTAILSTIKGETFKVFAAVAT